MHFFLFFIREWHISLSKFIFLILISFLDLKDVIVRGKIKRCYPFFVETQLTLSTAKMFVSIKHREDVKKKRKSV